MFLIHNIFIDMKKILLLGSLMIICISISAQVALTTMQLSENQHDFGIFKEEAGPQKYDFILTNTGKLPLVIQNVVASCGCTTPEWTRQPIPAGGKGKVTAIYDPKDRPGQFNKTLSVYTNTKPEVAVIVIKGEVTPREKTVEELFTFPVGAVRFESNHLAFTNVKKTEKKIRVMQIVNTSDAPVKIEFDQMPAHLFGKSQLRKHLKPGRKVWLKEHMMPQRIAPGGMSVTWLKLKLNGVPQENLYYYVSANLVEDFSSLSKDDLLKAPVFKLASSTVDLGKIKGSTQNEVEFKFTNEGKIRPCSETYKINMRMYCCSAGQHRCRIETGGVEFN